MKTVRTRTLLSLIGLLVVPPAVLLCLTTTAGAYKIVGGCIGNCGSGSGPCLYGVNYPGYQNADCCSCMLANYPCPTTPTWCYYVETPTPDTYVTATPINLVVSGGSNWTSNITSGPGAYQFGTNSSGGPTMVNLGVGLWQGTNFQASTTATQVDFYAISAAALATNIEADWPSLGHASYNPTNGVWGLPWTPPTNTMYMVAALVFDPLIASGVSTCTTVAMPQSLIPSISSVGDGQSGFAFRWVGPLGSNMALQTTAVLSNPSPWSTAVVVSNFSGQGFVIDSGSVADQQKFYRVTNMP